MEKERREQEKSKGRGRRPRPHHDFSLRLANATLWKVCILVGLSLVIAALLTPSFTTSRPDWQLGEVADRNVKARRDFLVEDQEATFKKRQEASRASPVVLDLDELADQEVEDRIEAAFETLRKLLSEEIQPPSPAREAPPASVESGAPSPAAPSPRLDLQKRAFEHKKEFERVLGLQMPDDVFKVLVSHRFGQDIQREVASLVESAFEQGIVAAKSILPADNRDILMRKAHSRQEELLPPPHAFIDIEEAQRFVRLQALTVAQDADIITPISFLAIHLVRPNLMLNRTETDRRREVAATAVKPVYAQVKRGEMIVREGQRLGHEDLARMKAHEEGESERHWLVILSTIFVFSMLCLWVLVEASGQHITTRTTETRDFLFLALLLTLCLALGRSALWLGDIMGEGSAYLAGKTLLLAVPLTAGAMMASMFLGVTSALLFSLLLTIFAGLLFGKDFDFFLYFLAGSFVAAHCVTRCSTRLVAMRAGLMVGLANVVLILLTAILHNQVASLRTLVTTLFGMSGGIFAGVLVTGLAPLAETAFGYATDTKLLELATMEQPLLQDLMVQAPGTYHHSIIVGNMVEAAAASVGANPLLAKVAAYYHDVGKTRKPLYFIENQYDGENRHEKLAPSMSSLILMAHVKDGVEIATAQGLPRPVLDIIGQHHGTSLIAFFYKKALELREKAHATKGADLPPVNVDDYRYPGPKPQTKEAGLVMVGDMVEAACRSLTDPTPARIQGMVNRIVNNVFTDGQLDECELTLKDLHQIARHFNQVMVTVHHKRIEYPGGGGGGQHGKAKPDAAPDPGVREAKADPGRPQTSAGDVPPHIKRLGLH